MGRPSVTLTPLPKLAYFEHRQPLIVVHRQHAVAAREHLRREQRIGRQRSFQVHARQAQLVQHRGNDLDFLAAEVAALAGVRVQTGDQEYAARSCRNAAAAPDAESAASLPGFRA